MTRSPLIDHGDPTIPPLKVPVVETVEIGPIGFFFSNQNLAMGLKSHSHHAYVYVVFETMLGGHGYPSFEETNDALRERIAALSGRGLFTNATNEDVCRRLFAWIDDYGPEVWRKWGGDYRLQTVILDVESVVDKIGHDNGSTRYTVSRHPMADYPQRYVTGVDVPTLPELEQLAAARTIMTIPEG